MSLAGFRVSPFVVRTCALLALLWPAAPAHAQVTPVDPAVPVAIDGPPAPIPPEVMTRDTTTGKATIRAIHLTQPLKVDGVLDEEVYAREKPFGNFLQVVPRYGQDMTERTEVWITYDDRNIYVSCRCYDSAPPDKWIANELRRDTNQLRQNDQVGVMFDTFYDRRSGFLFYTNPLGARADYSVVDEGGSNTDWNPVWTSKTGRFEGGWTVEMAIPFRSIRYRSGENQVWGLQLRRSIRRKNEWTHLTFVPAATGGAQSIFRVSAAGDLTALNLPAASRNIELKPYAITRLTTDRTRTPNINNDFAPEVGLDFKYGITANLTADVTVNTDFAQVEVDEQQVNLTRFPLFFPEKREFFLEGQGIFDFGGAVSTASNSGSSGLTPLLFFSRRIGLNNGRTIPIDVGGRLTGKVGKTSVGIIDVRAGTTATTPSTNFSVVRVKRDIFRRSSIGLLATNRSVSADGRDAAQAYGGDVAIGLYDNITINGYLAQAKNPGTNGHDTSYRAQVNYNGDRYGLQAERLAVDRNFDPQVGFLRRAAFTRTYGQARFSPRPKRRSSRVRKYTYLFNYDYITSPTGTLETRDVNAQFGVQFQNSDVFTLQTGRSFEGLAQPFAIAPGVRIPIGGYGFQDGTVSWNFGNQHKLSGTVAVTAGQFYDGDRLSLTYSSGRLELSPRVSVEPGVTYNQVHLPAGDFTTRLISSRGTFTVTPRMFFTGLVQYNSSTNAVSSNMRLRWEYRPGSELFVVYTDERDTLTRGIPDLRNRAFVVKMNRLLYF